MSQNQSIENLLHLLKPSTGNPPKFTLLIGAGASVSSGVSSGVQLIQEWRSRYDSGAVDENKLAKSQEWYSTAAEYGVLFEHFFPQPASRRDFIEECLSNATPSWGYLYLADLIQHGYFNTILTTNFDDLINEACLFYAASARPLVCSHDASITHFRLNSSRPKIIKLHGDFLFDSIRNTASETAALEKNTEHKVCRLAEETGLIVIGYGGNDESVMSCIQACLKENDKFPHGIYWCCRDTKRLSTRVKTLYSDRRFYVVQIENFDRFMAEAHQFLIGASPTVIANPLEVLSSRLTKLMSGISLIDAASDDKHPAVARDFRLLADKLSTDSPTRISFPVPVGLVGALTFARGEYEKAIPILLQDLRNMPIVGSLILLFECLRHHWNDAAYEEATAIIERGADAQQPAAPNWLSNITLSLIHARQFDAALRMCEISTRVFPKYPESLPQSLDYNTLNRHQITVHRGQQLSNDVRDEIDKMYRRTFDYRVSFGCLVLLRNYEGAINIVKNNPKRFDGTCVDWPIVDLLPPAERNQLRELIGAKKRHLGNVNFNFQINIDQEIRG